VPALGILHGPNALLIFGLAVMSFVRAKAPAATAQPAPVAGQTTTAV
jgi:hypothetical protein